MPTGQEGRHAVGVSTAHLQIPVCPHPLCAGMQEHIDGRMGFHGYSRGAGFPKRKKAKPEKINTIRDCHQRAP